MGQPLGEFVKYSELSLVERELVHDAWQVSRNADCFQSQFPTGTAILAVNDEGTERKFVGPNVENEYYTQVICGERTASVSAVAAGFRHFRMLAVACPKSPGPTS